MSSLMRSMCMLVVIVMLWSVFPGALGSPPDRDTVWVSVPVGVMLDTPGIRPLEDYGSFRMLDVPREIAGSVISQVPGARSLEHLKTVGLLQGSFDPMKGALHIPEGYAADAGYLASDDHHLVQMRGPVKPGWVKELSAYARLFGYYPHSTYLVSAEREALTHLRSMGYIRWVGPYEPFYKVEPALLAERGMLRILVDTFTAEDIPPVERMVVARGGWIEDVSRTLWHSRVVAHVPDGVIPLLAGMPGVRWLQRYHDAEFVNGQAQWVVQSGQPDQRPVWDRGLMGENQTVGYADTGLDYDHSFFRDDADPQPGPNHRKVIGYKRWASQDGDAMGHGTHVAGSIAGNDVPVGGSSVNIGQAPEANLYVDDVSNTGSDWSAPSDLNQLYAGSEQAGAALHSNSWGYPTEHTYTDAASDTDEFMWNHPEFLVVIAAGNERTKGQASLRSPGLAKNVVTVGATGNGGNADDMASFSSVGPTNPDGRLKPTVCAPGVNIMSAKSDGDLSTNNNGETQMSGTSMATPTTTGSLALVRQYFTEGWYPTGSRDPGDAFTPLASTLKATLMAGAVEISGQGSDYNQEQVYPNNSQGWGRINLDNSLYFQGDTSKLVIFEERTGISTGDSKIYSVGVLSDKAAFKVILVWTDYFGQPNADPAIVNDLDLEVKAPDGTVYLGNNFQGLNPGHSVPGGNADTVNVEEGVILPDAGTGLVQGAYQITVRGTNVPQGPQPFSIAVVGDVGYNVDHVEITPSPIEMEVGTTLRLKATAYDASNNVVTGIPFDWNVSTPALGNVTRVSADEADLTAGTKVMTGKVQAEAFGKSAEAPVSLKPGAFAGLLVRPSNVSVRVLESASFTASGSDRYGNPLPLPGSVTWGVTDVNGTISGSGGNVTFTAGTRAGVGKVVARSEGESGEAEITVLPGDLASVGMEEPVSVKILHSVNLTGLGFDEYGNPIPGLRFEWGLADPTLGSLSPSVGRVVTFTAGTHAGPASILLSGEGRSGNGTVNILPGEIVRLEAYPEEVEVDPFVQVSLNAVGRDEYDNPVESEQIYWQMEGPDIGRLVGRSGPHVKFESYSVFGADGTVRAGYRNLTDTVHIHVRPAYMMFSLVGLVIGGAVALLMFRRLRKVTCPACGRRTPKKSGSCVHCWMPLQRPVFEGVSAAAPDAGHVPAPQYSQGYAPPPGYPGQAPPYPPGGAGEPQGPYPRPDGSDGARHF